MSDLPRQENAPDATSGIHAHPQRPSFGLDARREVFRELVRNELADRRLTWWDRRCLAHYGTVIGLDRFEARIIIRALEYHAGHAPSSPPNAVAPPPRGLPGAASETTEPRPERLRAFLAFVLVAAMILAYWMTLRG